MNKEKWIAAARDMGIDAFEIYESISRSRDTTWFEGQMDTFTTSNTFGISLRGIVDGNVAYIALEEVDDSRMEEILNQLKEQAKRITTDETAILVGPQECEIVENPHTWKQPSMEKVYAVLKEVEEKVSQADPRVVQVAFLGWSESFSSREITNSLGLEVLDKEGFQYLACSAVVSENGQIKDDTLIKIVPDLDAFDIDGFVKELVDEALRKLGGASISSGSYPVILKRDAMTSLFAAFTGLFSGDLIGKGISPLRDKLHEKIFSDKITIIDDPRNTDALSIANFDDEGFPTSQKIIVKDGVFEQMIHSTKSAARMHTESTGNGFKSGYASAVGVSPYDMYIVPGEKSLEEMEAEMGDGLVITDLAGLHAGIDFVSTSFSLQCSGYLIKDGKRSRAVTLITVADTFMELMNKVVEVGSDLDWKYYSVCAPSIYFSSCAISGE